MRTNMLFGTVALVALMGTASVAQVLMDTDGLDELEFQMTANGTRQIDENGAYIIIMADGTRVPQGAYGFDAAGTPFLTDPEFAMAEVDAEGNRTFLRQTQSADGGQFIVEQAEPRVSVEVAEPVVTVDQATPEVTVQQPQPEIVVTQQQPRVTVQQQAPIITVEQEQPIVTVRIPEPVVTIRMPQPDVSVATAQPEVQVVTPQPVVRFVRPEPKIIVQEAEPQINVMQGEAQVAINRAEQAEVRIEQAEAQVVIEEEAAEAEIVVTEAEPVVNIEDAGQAEVQVEQADAAIVIEEADGANVEVAEGAAMEMNREILLDTERRSAGLIMAEEDDSMRTMRLDGYGRFATMGVADIVGMNVLAESGEDVGEIDNVGMIGDRIVAIVGVGGFLGLGEHDVALPLERFSMVGDDLVVQGMSAQMLEDMDEYNADTVRFLPADGMIADAL